MSFKRLSSLGPICSIRGYMAKMSKEHMKEYANYSPVQLKKHIKEEKQLVKKKESKKEKKMHEAEAGRKSNKSEKHRKAESKGMKKAMRGY